MKDDDDDEIAVTRMALMVEALRLYPFRPPAADETLPAYLAALQRHVAEHDWAAAEEIRLGRPQAEWTPEEVQAFVDRMIAMPRSQHEPPADGHFQVGDIEPCGHWPISDAALGEICDELITLQLEQRVKDPASDLPILAGVLLLNGDLMVMAVGRRDRIAALRYLAQRAPVYGFVLVFDAFCHVIDKLAGKAVKQDVILGHLGTRTRRLVKRRPYRYVEDRRRVIVDPPLEDLNPRDGHYTVEDPYAEIFVSVPTPTGRPS